MKAHHTCASLLARLFGSSLVIIPCWLFAGVPLIDFDCDTTLVAFYKAGLQPRHFDGLASRVLAIPATRLQFKLGGVVFPEVNVSSVSIDMRSEINPSYVTLRLEPMPFEQMLGLCENIFPKIGRPVSGVRQMINGIIKDPEHPPEAIQETWQSGKLRVAFAFIENFGGWNTDLTMNIGIRFPTDGIKPYFGLEPLKPPPGYEHLSMEPSWPSGFPRARSRQSPDNSPDAPAALNAPGPHRNTDSSQRTADPTSTHAATAPNWLLWATLLVIGGSTVVILLRCKAR